VVRPSPRRDTPNAASFVRDLPGRVMVPGHARPAHRRLRQKLAEMAEWNEDCALNRLVPGGPALGIIASGISFMHAREAAPEASVLKLGFTHPLPMRKIAAFAAGVQSCVVIEEGDPYLADAIRAAGIAAGAKPEMYRFGELDVARVRRILRGDINPEPVPPPGKPPQLCEACSYRVVFESLRRQNCIVAGDIGCYTLGALKPFEAMDSCVCMGASLGIGLGLRHVLPPDQACRVVSVIGDSTFVHSGISGLVEMAYNPPPNGHVVIILDNATTAMTGHQEHPGTGRNLSHEPAAKLVLEDMARACGIRRVQVIEPRAGSDAFDHALAEALKSRQLAVIIARRPCILIARQLKEYEQRDAEQACQCHENGEPCPAAV
jgi:indolepyruvate ferredoxin oxidoreductase alpha subunit